jgi:hypothetical protein
VFYCIHSETGYNQFGPVFYGFFAVPDRGSWILKLSGTGRVRGLSKKGNGTRTGPDFKALLPSNKFLQLVDKLPRSHSAILIQLRTGHAPLNHHLFRIRCSETPVCPHCGNLTVKTVGHYLLQCPHYQHKRHTLRRKLKRSANSLSFLLSDSSASKPLIKYIVATKRFENLNNNKT